MYAFSVRKVCIRGIFVYVAFVYGDVRTRGKCGDFSLFEDCFTEIGRPLRGRRGVGFSSRFGKLIEMSELCRVVLLECS